MNNIVKVKYKTQDDEVKDYTVIPIAAFTTKAGKQMLSVAKLSEETPTDPNLKESDLPRRSFALEGIQEFNGRPVKRAILMTITEMDPPAALDTILTTPRPEGDVRFIMLEETKVRHAALVIQDDAGVIKPSVWPPAEKAPADEAAQS